jgi:molybdenum cofactor biosynthesis enzyme MoaA
VAGIGSCGAELKAMTGDVISLMETHRAKGSHRPTLPRPHSTSRVFRFSDGRGRIGFVNPVSAPFCLKCDRLRIAAEGRPRTCLFALGETDLCEPPRDAQAPP